MINFQKGDAVYFINNYKRILQTTNEEAGQLGNLNPNIPIYSALDKEGHLLALTILNDDVPIGYTTITSMYGMHNSDKLIAIVDILYIAPEYRSYKVFKDTLNNLEQYLKQYKISILQIASPEKRDISKLLERVKYKPLEKVYFKNLE